MVVAMDLTVKIECYSNLALRIREALEPRIGLRHGKPRISLDRCCEMRGHVEPSLHIGEKAGH